MNEDLRRRAVKLLARREHTRTEMERKLSHLADPEEVTTVLNALQNEGLLSDARFAESYVRSHAARFGALRLRQTLRSKGVAEELIGAGLAQTEVEEELLRAQAVWSKKFAALPADMHEWARQERFLQGRGFGADIIRRVLKGIEE